MSNAKYYINIKYFYEKCGVHNYRFSEPFASEQEAMKFVNSLANGAIDELRSNSPVDKRFHILKVDKEVDIICFATGEDGKTIVPSIIFYTVVQDN